MRHSAIELYLKKEAKMNKKTLIIIIGIVLLLAILAGLFFLLPSSKNTLKGDYFTAQWSGNGTKAVKLNISGAVPEGYSWKENADTEVHPFNLEYLKVKPDLTKLKLTVNDGSCGTYDFVCSNDEMTEYSRLRLTFYVDDGSIDIQSAMFLNEAKYFRELTNDSPFDNYISVSDYALTFKVPDEKASWFVHEYSEGLDINQDYDLDTKECLFEITASTPGALTAVFASSEYGSQIQIDINSEAVMATGEDGTEYETGAYRINPTDSVASDFADPRVQEIMSANASAASNVVVPAGANITESYTAKLTKADGETFVDDGDKMLCLEYNIDGTEYIHYLSDNYTVDDIKNLWKGLDTFTRETSGSAEIYSSPDMPVSVACWTYAGTANALISKSSKDALINVLPELLK